MKLPCCSQKFSNLKIAGFGTLVETEMMHDEWFEESLDNVDAKEFGTFDVKNQSNLSKRGLHCLFVQVKLAPLKGSSTNLRLLIALLKANMS